eukprot:gene2414-2896_t
MPPRNQVPLSSAAFTAREKGISLTVEVDLHPRLTTNARQVRDRNVRELGPLAASGTYRRSLAHQVVKVTVRDTGVGLSQ